MVTSSILFFLLTSVVYADVATTSTVCATLSQSIPGSVFFANDTQYQSEQSHYWNIGLTTDAPACIVLPDTVEKVSTAVKIVGADSTIKFAVKSGGHDPNPSHSAINGGVLIALSQLNGTTFDAAKGVAYVKPGGTWSTVIRALEPFNVTVVGGRLGVVGIGGYLTGGGLSFLSAQYGLACDSIVEFEVVQPNGTIALINAQSSPKVFTAMKGSGNQFGVVTKFTLQTYPIGQVWGGYRIYDMSQQPAIIKALQQFIENPSDPKAAVIVNANQRAPIGNFFQIFYFYDGPTPPSEPFKGMLEVPATILDSTETRSYSNLLDFNGQGAGDTGMRSSFRSLTLPLIPGNNGTFFNKIVEDWTNLTSSYFNTYNTTTLALAIQSFPSSMGKASAAAGGNALGLSGSDKQRFVLELSNLWGDATDSSQDQNIYDLSQEVADTIQRQISKEAEGQDVECYNPYFMNDAFEEQDVLGSYQDSRALRALQKKIDPQGVFGKRVGGFKF